MKTNWQMRAAVIQWLRYERGCMLICWERCPVFLNRYRPDIIAVMKNRMMIEVEEKQSIADFKANAGKDRGYAERAMRQFYFVVPPEIADKAMELLPEGAGLLTYGEEGAISNSFGPMINVRKGAKVNKEAHRLELREMAAMAMDQTASLHRACAIIWKMQKRGKANA